MALAVVAIALGALLTAGSQSARTGAHLRDKTIAMWVASNLTAEVGLGGAPPVGEIRGKAMMAGRTWYWIRRTETTGDSHLFRVGVRVFARPLEIRPGVAEGALAELSTLAGNTVP